jgi:hypothetical protein
MATSEIEKLERRYAENPHGLTFAPLAEVHRKNGDLPRALELLTAGLELHPNYIPASIVLGRCHQDLGNLPAAEAAFAHVLRLDDENVIALKSLADINERLERFDDAETWLRRLVAVDRSNDEAREQLQRLESAKNGGRPGTAAEAVAASEPTLEPVDTPTPEAPSAEVARVELPPVDLAGLDIIQPAAEPERPPEPMVLERTPELSELKSEKIPSITDAPPPPDPGAVQPMAGLVSQEFEPPREPVSAPLEFIAIDVETSEEVVLKGSGESEYRVPNAAEDFSESMGTRAETRKSDAPEAREPEALKDAVENPKTPVEAPAPRAEASKIPSYTARESQGQSVAAFFRTMLAARPPESDSRARVQEGLSLSSVMGQERSAAPPPGGEGAEAKPEGIVSFDDFFGSKGEAAGAEKGGEPGKDDLDEFHSWLQNLKR